jgi:serine/threonine protein phosphatase PrpC
MHRFSVATASPRARSEDRAMAVPAGDGWVIVVADGAGGVSGGASAAEVVITGVERSLADEAFDPASTADWVDLLEALDEVVADAPHAGETTVIAFGVTASGIVGASCGDSQAWLWTPAGRITLTERQHRTRLGTRRARVQAFHAAAAGTLLVASDGLFDYAPADDIQRIALGGDGAAEALIALVQGRNRTLPDDIAVVVGWLDAR